MKALKKPVVWIIGLALIAGMVLQFSLIAKAETSGDYEYTVLDDETAEITRYVGSATEIEIPGKLDGYTVTSIGTDAFYDCVGLTRIMIPESVKSIGANAFRNCISLTGFTIPESVTSIGACAFFGCSGFTSIIVASENPVYDSRDNCNAVIEKETNTLVVGCKSTTIPEGVTSIGYGAFYGCISLTSIELPNGVTGIEDYAFFDCSGLTSIMIPESVTSIGDDAFSGCSSLTSITIPKGMTRIKRGAFYGCSSLTSIKLPNGVTGIGAYAFEDCSSLISIELPNSAIGIGYSAFSGCSSLTSIKIPEGCWSDLEGAFWGCSSLTSIELPNSLIRIGEYAFDGCTSLTNITIPEGVTSIGEYAFDGCSGLTSITIPKGVTRIKNRAFYGCSSLADVYYSGSENDWIGIFIESNNMELLNAKIHYNSGQSSAQNTKFVNNAKVYKNYYQYSFNQDDKFKHIKSGSTVGVTFDAGIYEDSGKLTDMIIKWDFAKFSASSSIPNNDLAIAAAVLSANAYNLTLLGETLETLGFIDANYYNYNGYDDINRVGNSISRSVKMIDGKETTVIAVVCRGTVGLLHPDMASNFFQQSQGFRYAADDIKKDLETYIETRHIDTSKPTKIFITGHSRGAAVAGILGTMVSDIASDENVFVYTFASPNSTTEDNRKSYRNIYNILNYDDFVTAVPIMNVAGAKFGNEIWFQKNQTSQFDYYFSSLTGLNDPFYILHHPLSWCNGSFGQQYMFSFRNHCMAVYMAYLLGAGIYSGSYGNGSQTRISIECPVDVQVYDSSNTMIGSIINNVAEESLLSNGIYTVVDGDKKYLYVPSDREISLVLSGTDTGEMKYTVQKIDLETNHVVEQNEFSEVALTNGKTMLSDVAEDIEINDIHLFVQENSEISAEIDSSGNETDVVMISFDTGSGNPIRDMPVPVGSTVNELPVAELDGYQFDGWYLEQECKTPFNYDEPIEQSVTLYAAFSEAKDMSGGISSLDYDGNHLTAILDYQYKNISSKIATLLYLNGKILAVNISGTDKNDTQTTVDFSIPDLYGSCALKSFYIDDKGSFIPIGRDNSYDAMFQCGVIDSDCLYYTDGEGISTVIAADNSVIPSSLSVGDSVFDGWYIDSEFTGKCDFTDFTTDGSTVYAKWKEKEDSHVMVKHDAVAATCVNDGNIEYYFCSNCQKYFSDENGENEISQMDTVIKATGHDWGEWTIVTPATEKAEGLEERVCKNDPEHKETRPIKKLESTAADYAAVDAAIGKIPENLTIYTESSVHALEQEIAAVDRNLKKPDQEKVDLMAKAIEDAIAALEIKPNGLYNLDGSWKYYEKGVFTAATGMVKCPDNNKWYYVDNGVLTKKTGLVQMVGKKNWYYVEKGLYNNKATGVVKRISDGKFFYVKSGKLDKTFTGVAADLSGKNIYYVTKGQVKAVTDVLKDGSKWKYFVKGKFTASTGVVARSKDKKWVYINKGVVTASTGMAKRLKDNKWVYVEKGVLSKKTGLVQRISDKKWFYVQKGVYNNKYTGGVQRISDKKWFYVAKGQLNKATGIAKCTDGKYRYFKNGSFNKLTGKAKLIGTNKVYKVKNGILVK